jgi:hypothetical protein
MGKKKQEPAKAAAPAAKPVAPGAAAAMPASTIKRGPMNGLMQDWKLTVDKVIEHAYLNHGNQEIVTRTVEGPIVRSTSPISTTARGSAPTRCWRTVCRKATASPRLRGTPRATSRPGTARCASALCCTR